METTLAKVLSLPKLALRQVAGGDPDASRAVRWVAVSELLDPTPYLEGGEILLTTGMNLKTTDQSGLDEYMRRLAARGVVAVGLGVGLTHPAIPTALSQAADRLELPLIEVPPPTPFIAITRAVADLVGEAEQEAIRRSLEGQRLMTRATVRPNAEASILRELSKLLGARCAVLNTRGEILADAGSGPLPVEATQAEIRRLRPKGLRAASSTSVGKQRLQVIPLGTAGQPHRYLAVASGGPRTADAALMATAVSLLSLVHGRVDSAAEVHLRLRRESARRLLDGDVATATGILSATSGGELADPVVVVVAEGRVDKLLDDVQESTGPFVYDLMPDGSLVLVVDHGAMAQVLDSPSAADLRIGVSEPLPLASVPLGLQHARHALSALTHDTGQTGRFETLSRQGVRGLIDPDTAKAWAESTLSPLRAYEQEGRRVDLLTTLEVFLAHHGQWLPAAAELEIHRHTLRYRIRLIESLLERTLNTPETRMDLWFALQMTH